MDIRLVANRIIIGSKEQPLFEATGDEVATILRAGHTIGPTRVIGTLFGEKYNLEVTTQNNEVAFALTKPTGGRLELPTHNILMKVVIAIAYNHDQKRGK